ncbi:MAG: FKBP-type peptidyl-prolyl cis-trans isomerase, partial [Hymenobacteraceae bacterium]|nr:FKBP-type peptidyl-prolyl cis-trans isomerase [Hymenobacteraceae bacterium]MDX5395619.1 FKBP-type peptidyl-prolyl cis-trans isomerase [Hymenobacteraceae bacterium]MDX5511673.1 FKBP-type peptidyl-prolyl cis-trans isomerase [Hymenobacteraceae bacterium]
MKLFKFCLLIYIFCSGATAFAQAPSDTVRTASGLKYVVTKEGKGKPATLGDKVYVRYTGRFPDGRIFDTSDLEGKPIKIKIGKDRIIKGWEEMLLLLQPGQAVTVVIPPHLAYGNRSIPNPDQQGDVLIPPGSTLI